MMNERFGQCGSASAAVAPRTHARAVPLVAARCSRRAAVLTYILFLLPVFLVLSALAVDIGYLYTAHAELQNAADSAALAGVSGIKVGPGEVRERALYFSRQNPVFGHADTLTSDDDIQLGLWDAETRTFTRVSDDDEYEADSCKVSLRLTGDNALGLFFGPLVGLPTADVEASATAQFGTSRSWDVMIVQDVSGSFNDDLPTAKSALHYFVQCLRDHSGEDTRAGLVAFERVSFLKAELQTLGEPPNAPIDQAINALHGCCMCPFGGANPCAHPDVCANYPECLASDCFVCKGTSIAAGLDRARLCFPPPPPAPPTFGRAIVLFTDGLPNCGPPNCCGTNEPCCANCVPQAQALAVTAANAAAAADISIFVVYYGEDATASTFLQTLVRGSGVFHETPNPQNFDTLLWQICASLPGGLRE